MKNKRRAVTIHNREDNSYFVQITVPATLSKLLYKETEVPPKPTHALVNSLIDVPKVTIATPFALMMGLGAPDVTERNKEPINFSFPARWPTDTPTHFKFEENNS